MLIQNGEERYEELGSDLHWQGGKIFIIIKIIKNQGVLITRV